MSNDKPRATPISNEEAFDALRWSHKHDRLIEDIIESGRVVDPNDIANELAARTNMTLGEEVNRIVASFRRRTRSGRPEAA